MTSGENILKKQYEIMTAACMQLLESGTLVKNDEKFNYFCNLNGVVFKEFKFYNCRRGLLLKVLAIG